ncbi:MAG: deoxyribose-phosphate aldolase [Ilumatobacteraceae bacterium]
MTAAVARRVLSLLDLTNLQDDCTADDVVELCRRARGPFGRTAAVCVWPRFVATARQALQGSGVLVATVVNFPHGGTDVEAVLAETTRSLDDGADEIDCVLPYRAFRSGDIDAARRLLTAVHAQVSGRAHLKVILETGELADDRLVIEAARLAIDCGADFIKTSTGKTSVSATPAAARSILEVIASADRPVGFKPSGGIRTLADAANYLDLADEIVGPTWATPSTFRFGASGLLDAVESVLAASS